MANLTASLTISLIDQVSGPAARIAGSLRDMVPPGTAGISRPPGRASGFADRDMAGPAWGRGGALPTEGRRGAAAGASAAVADLGAAARDTAAAIRGLGDGASGAPGRDARGRFAASGGMGGALGDTAPAWGRGGALATVGRRGAVAANASAAVADPGALGGRFAASGGMAGALGGAAAGHRAIDRAADVGAAAAEVSQLAHHLGAAAGDVNEVGAARQAAMADIATVLTPDNAIGGDVGGTMTMIMDAMRATSGGVSEAGRVAGVRPEAFLGAVFGGLASGQLAEVAIAGADQASVLARAGQTTAPSAGNLLSQVFQTAGDHEAIAAADPAQRLAVARVEMERLSDILAATQDSFAFTGGLDQLGGGLKNVLGIASAMGVPLEQTMALVGALNTVGVTGPEAGTALKSALAVLPAAADKLGFSIARTAEGGVDMVATMRGLSASGVSAEALIGAFGTEAGPAVSHFIAQLALIDAGMGKIAGSAGVTMDNAATAADTLTASEERLNARTQVFQDYMAAGTLAVRQWGVDAASAAVGAANGLAGVMPWLPAVAGGILQLGAGIAAPTAGLLELSSGVLSTVTLLSPAGPLGAATKFLGRGLGGAAAGIGKLAMGMLAALPAIWSFASGMIAASWPVLLVVAGIAALAVVAWLLIKHWDAVVAFFGRAWGAIKGFFAGAARDIMDSPIMSFGRSLIESFSGVVGRVAGFVVSIARLIKSLGGIRGFFTFLWESVTTVISEAWERIAGPDSLIGRIAAAISAGIGMAKDLFVTALRSLFSPADDLTPHSDAAEGPLSRLTAAGAAIPATIADGITLHRDVFVTALRSLFSPADDVLPQPGEALRDVLEPSEARGAPAAADALPRPSPAAARDDGELAAAMRSLSTDIRALLREIRKRRARSSAGLDLAAAEMGDLAGVP